MSAPLRPAYPREEIRGIHAECGDRLVPGAYPKTLVHERTGTVRCPPITRVCGVCDREAMFVCSDPGCPIIGHPGCLNQCVCCERWGCPAHVSSVDYLCGSCAVPGHGGDHGGGA